ncbi:hypothetical protein LCGC14_2552660 [marine sediment metagenome]|uniref:Uncharacterized protein n=1 Tax=marine sediment metagenome TaxID=412755 RepID=A0A0F9DFH0_9ZZZZ
MNKIIYKAIAKIIARYYTGLNSQSKRYRLESEFLTKILNHVRRQTLNEAIVIFRKLPGDEPMTPLPVILELKGLQHRIKNE